MNDAPGLRARGVSPEGAWSRRSGGYGRLVVLYTCPVGKAFGDWPGALAQPCGRAAKALDEAGHAYEWKVAKGGIIKPWTWPSRARDRAEVQALSGQRSVPILVLDNGAVITGSMAVARWANDNAPQAAATG